MGTGMPLPDATAHVRRPVQAAQKAYGRPPARHARTGAGVTKLTTFMPKGLWRATKSEAARRGDGVGDFVVDLLIEGEASSWNAGEAWRDPDDGRSRFKTSDAALARADAQVPTELKDAMKASAAAVGRTLNDLVCEYLISRLEWDEE